MVNRLRPAVFLDRDGTLIEHVPYLTDPRDVRLLPDAAEALRRLHDAGFACVLVTNQSAIGRGWLTEDGLRLIHEELTRQLVEQEVGLDAIYYCPEAPTGGDRDPIEHLDRKPGPGMLLRAARDLELDLGASWMIGDMTSDALAGRNAGCRGSILVRTGSDPGHADEGGDEFPICEDLTAAVSWILRRRGRATPRLPDETTELVGSDDPR